MGLQANCQIASSLIQTLNRIKNSNYLIENYATSQNLILMNFLVKVAQTEP
jgi:hypothetical protein